MPASPRRCLVVTALKNAASRIATMGLRDDLGVGLVARDAEPIRAARRTRPAVAQVHAQQVAVRPRIRHHPHERMFASPSDGTARIAAQSTWGTGVTAT